MKHDTTEFSVEEFSLFIIVQSLFKIFEKLAVWFGKNNLPFIKNEPVPKKSSLQLNDGVWIIFNSLLHSPTITIFSVWGEIDVCTGAKDVLRFADLILPRIQQLPIDGYYTRIDSNVKGVKIIKINSVNIRSGLRKDKLPFADLSAQWQMMTGIYKAKSE